MPLTRRNVSPVALNRECLPPQVQRDELECVANRTITNLIRQLASLSKHAEHIFGEMYHDAMRLEHKTNQLKGRVDKLTLRLTTMDSANDEGALDELEMRKAFKSSSLIDQRTLDRDTLPSALVEQYEKCDAPPNLDLLNPYRESRENALSLYTNPSFFFDLWRSEMLKECTEMRPQGKRRSPRKQKQRRDENEHRLVSSLATRGGTLSFPDEYQAPAALGIQRREWREREQRMEGSGMGHSLPPLNVPHGMSRPPVNMLNHGMDKTGLVSNGLHELGSGMNEWMEDEQEDLPPPPPQVVATTSLINTMIGGGAPIELMEPVAGAVSGVVTESMVVPPAPPPPPPPPPPPANAVASFANAPGTSTVSRPNDTRGNLLAEIQAGHKLKKVAQEEAAAEKESEGKMDVAAILRRRFEQVHGRDESEEEDEEDNEWDD